MSNEDGQNVTAQTDEQKAEAERLAAEKAKSTPSDAEAKLLKEVMEKKEAARVARDEAAAAKAENEKLAAKLAQFDGIDLDSVKELLKEKAERETAELEKRGEWDRLKAQMVEAHKAEVERIRAEAQTATATATERAAALEKRVQEATIGRSFSDSTFIREDLTLTPSKARIIYGPHFDVVDGKVIAYDKPTGTADRTPLVDGDGEPLSFEKAIAKLVEIDPDRDNLLKSKIRSGSGSENDPDVQRREKERKLTGRERIAASIKGGALKLPNNQPLMK